MIDSIDSPTPTCPLCDSPSRPELPFATADPDALYWRCQCCDWLFATPKPPTPDERESEKPAPCPSPSIATV